MQEHPIHTLSADLLLQLVSELDNESVRAIILRGSYAREDASFPYSDVDLTCIIKESAGSHLAKRFFWKDGYLISVSTYSYAAYRARLARPEEAIFAVSGIQEARNLLDKDGAFLTFQEEVKQFQWAPLQQSANIYAGQILSELSEVVLRVLKVLHPPHESLLAKLLIYIISDVSIAVAVQKGILVQGQGYFDQLRETVGRTSLWTSSHICLAGDRLPDSPTLYERAWASLQLYQETFYLLESFLSERDYVALKPLITLIETHLLHKDIE